MQHGISAAALLPLFRSGGAFHDHLIVSFAAISRTVTAITATDANSPISERNTRPARPPPKEKAMSLRAGLQTWTRVAALLRRRGHRARSALRRRGRDALRPIFYHFYHSLNAETAISATAADTSAPVSATGPGGPPDATLPPVAAAAAEQASSSTIRRRPACPFERAVPESPRLAAAFVADIRAKSAAYCAASLAIACSFAAVSSLREVGCGMAMML